VTDRPDFLSSG